MATLTTFLKSAHGKGNPSRKPYLIENVIDLTESAIDCSSGDIVQALTVPTDTVILWAGIQVKESATMNTGTNATAILGTAVDPNEYVAAFDIDGASDGVYAPTVAQAGVLVAAAADRGRSDAKTITKAQCALRREFFLNRETFAHWPGESCTGPRPCP